MMASYEDFRKDAEERAIERWETFSSPSSLVMRSRSYSTVPRARSQRLDAVMSPLEEENTTPLIAKIAEKDYILIGSRARAATDEFIPPRWIPDLAANNCHLCNVEFEYTNRRHHCRYCGQVICASCLPQSLLLPIEFGYRDPQRVCTGCATLLSPLQTYLSTNIANHQRVNTIDIASDNSCNVRPLLNLPYANTLGSEIRKAAYSLHNLLHPSFFVGDKGIPLRLIAQAKGLAFLTVIKGGFFLGGKLGTGLVISRLPRELGGGWSAPSSIATMGISWGALIGCEVTDYIIILNTPGAVLGFAGLGQMTIGAGLVVAVGPMGRAGSADIHLSDITSPAPAYSYSHSKGLYAGVSLDGSVILPRHGVNHNFYGRPITPIELLNGSTPAPRAASPLYTALGEVLASLPDVSHRRPSPLIGLQHGSRAYGHGGGHGDSGSSYSGSSSSHQPLPYPGSINLDPGINPNQQQQQYQQYQQQQQQQPLSAPTTISTTASMFPGPDSSRQGGYQGGMIRSTFSYDSQQHQHYHSQQQHSQQQQPQPIAQEMQPMSSSSKAAAERQHEQHSSSNQVRYDQGMTSSSSTDIDRELERVTHIQL